MRKLIPLIILGSLLACNRTTEPEEGPAEPSYGTVSCGADNGGNVVLQFTAPNGTTPIVGAKVSIGSCVGKTDSSGTIEMLNVPEGTQTINIEKGVFRIDTSIGVQSGQTVNLGTVNIPPDMIKMGVILGDFDRIEEILARLGFVFDTIPFDSVVSGFSQMNNYDYLFFNCGSQYSTYTAQQAAQHIRDFLSSGDKRVYASDWAYILVEYVDSGAIDFYGDDTTYAPEIGETGTVTATVVDSDLIEALGRTSMDVNFDLGSWVVMTGAGSNTQVLIRGDAIASSDTLQNVPFSVIFPYGQGKVIYTSFHNEAQNTQDMDITLEQMILK